MGIDRPRSGLLVTLQLTRGISAGNRLHHQTPANSTSGLTRSAGRIQCKQPSASPGVSSDKKVMNQPGSPVVPVTYIVSSDLSRLS